VLLRNLRTTRVNISESSGADSSGLVITDDLCIRLHPIELMVMTGKIVHYWNSYIINK